MKILFLMRSMAVGGTQRQVTVLCRELLRRGHEVTVLLYYTGEPLDAELRERGARIIDLKKRGRWHNFSFLMRLIWAVRTEKPDVVYAHLPLPNLLALLLRYVGNGCAVACGVRASDMNQPKLDWLMHLSAQLERRLVRHADVVIVNSRTGARYLRGDRELPNLVLIENGIETESFSFDESGRRRMRSTWQLPDETPVIGCVARLDPMKDHVTLLRAFALLRNSYPEARLICVGTMVESYASELMGLARQLQIDSAVRWIERESQLRDLYSAFDALCLSSVSEGFPNVLAEAMACGVPCVATDVGDASRILSSADFLVPPRDPDSLARALAGALAQGRTFSELRTEKIGREFSVHSLADRTEVALTAAVRRKNLRVARSGVGGSLK
jgi:glycosyltransferase involved in cell wall biosynthesis